MINSSNAFGSVKWTITPNSFMSLAAALRHVISVITTPYIWKASGIPQALHLG